MTSSNSRLCGCVIGMVVSAAVISCGGPPDAASPAPSPSASAAMPAAPSAAPTATPTSAPTAMPAATMAWKDMSHDQRMDLMRSQVLPKMKVEFAAYDAKRFGNITCGTCHGEGAKDGSWKMPNPKIMPHVPSDMPGFEKLGKDQPEAMKFMATVVEPKMAQILGVPAYDPKTDKGFGCHDCHTDK